MSKAGQVAAAAGVGLVTIDQGADDVGARLILKMATGTVAALATTSGANLRIGGFDGGGNWTGGAAPPGTWRNLAGQTLGDGQACAIGLFQRMT